MDSYGGIALHDRVARSLAVDVCVQLLSHEFCIIQYAAESHHHGHGVERIGAVCVLLFPELEVRVFEAQRLEDGEICDRGLLGEFLAFVNDHSDRLQIFHVVDDKKYGANHLNCRIKKELGYEAKLRNDRRIAALVRPFFSDRLFYVINNSNSISHGVYEELIDRGLKYEGYLEGESEVIAFANHDIEALRRSVFSKACMFLSFIRLVADGEWDRQGLSKFRAILYKWSRQSWFVAVSSAFSVLVFGHILFGTIYYALGIFK